ncbi:hypothetical protein PGT21_026469 [Puccinia graminis f. sp. tritici]|uniref:Uncharacterized protein n=1 Tax=Puccinia graminis f. sp. tritici TaxID=56615 RepID=A0A5B0QYG3_PUCGR|nr:hypothetical protein PGT21_026469 [Puccinia graminis f. sp. tritici]
MTDQGSGKGPVQAPRGPCVDSKLGIWLAETGGRFHPKLVFGAPGAETSRDMGMTVYADGPINRREVLASCSVKAVIDRKNSLERIGKLLSDLELLDEKSHRTSRDPERDGTGLDHFLDFLDRAIISLYLILTKLSLRLRSRKSAEDPSPVDRLLHELFSFHEEYVRLLPETEELMTPLFWNDAELQKLRSTSLLPTTDQQRELWTNEYECFVEKIRNLSPSLHALITQHTSCLDYFWASTMVNSRSFPSTLLATSSGIANRTSLPTQPDTHLATPAVSPQEEAPILLPGVDIFNHKRGSKVEWRPVNADSPVQCIEIVSLEDQIPRGEQVFNNYGPKSTGELIVGYGFALGEEDWKLQAQEGEKMESNPDDFYPVKLSQPRSEEAYSALIGEIFERFESDDLLHHVRRDGILPPLLLAQLRISLISSDQELRLASQRLQEALRLESSKEFLDRFTAAMDQKLNWENELNCLDCLSSLFSHKLNALSSSDVFHPHADWSQVRAPVKRMIEIYSKGQLDILKDILKVVKDNFELSLEDARADGFEFDAEDDDE